MQREPGGNGGGGGRRWGGGGADAENAEIGMYPAGYSTMERIDSLFNYVFRQVTSTTTLTFHPPVPRRPVALFQTSARSVYSNESFSAPLWKLDG